MTQTAIFSQKKECHPLTYGDSLHPHAVDKYNQRLDIPIRRKRKHDTTQREGPLSYDTRDRMTSMETAGRNRKLHIHPRRRTNKEKPERTEPVTYSIAGLYELALIPGETARHTKYIKGMNGETVAQITRTDVNAAYGLMPNSLRDGKYSDNPFVRFVCEAIDLLNQPADLPSTLPLWYILGLTALAGGVYFQLRDPVRRKKVSGYAGSMILCISVAMSGAGCAIGDGYIDYSDGTPNPEDSINTIGFPKLGTYYYHPDQLGSVRMITDQTGAVVYKTEYTAYGEHIPEKTSGNRSTHFTYTSQEEDDTGLMYYGARYYDAEIGRFAQADTVIDGAFSTQGWNRYMYCQGNPINWTDPTGMNAKDGLNGKGQSSVRDHKGKHHGGGSTTPQQLRERRLREQRRREQQANQDKYGGQNETTATPVQRFHFLTGGLVNILNAGCNDPLKNKYANEIDEIFGALKQLAIDQGIPLDECCLKSLKEIQKLLDLRTDLSNLLIANCILDSLANICGISECTASLLSGKTINALSNIIDPMGTSTPSGMVPDIKETASLIKNCDDFIIDTCAFGAYNEMTNHENDDDQKVHDFWKNIHDSLSPYGSNY